MKSTQGLSILSIFDLLIDQIEAALPLEDAMTEISNTKGVTHGIALSFSSCCAYFGCQ